MRKLRGHEVICPCCEEITDMNRGASSSATANGVFITCWCDCCGAKLLVKTVDKDGRFIDNIVVFPLKKSG